MRTYYLRDKNNHPKGSVGIKDGRMSFAICSRKENFDKKKARMIVEGRMNIGKTSEFIPSSNFDLKVALSAWGLLSPAKKQKIDLERAEYVLKKILENEEARV